MRDVQRMMRANLAAGPDRVALVTVTAPGADVLPWDGAHVEAHAAVVWNRSAARRWSKLNRAVRERLRRAGHRSPLLTYIWQLQRRGVLHLHLVLAFGEDDEPAARLYVAVLRELAASYGFGFIDFRDRDGKAGRSSVMPREVAAGYLSRYSVDSGQLAEACSLEERPTRLFYMTRDLTARTLVTMRRLRRLRYLYVLKTLPPAAVFSLARVGHRPRWLSDASEYAAVCSLARAP